MKDLPHKFKILKMTWQVQIGAKPLVKHACETFELLKFLNLWVLKNEKIYK
jgi:hypothetical protein